MAISNSYFVMPMNMDRVCRICLSENTNLSPIFCNSQDAGNLVDLPQKIQVCGDVECHDQDGLPSLICDVCIYKANFAHEFRQLCQLSDARLRLYYNKPSKYSTTDPSVQDEKKDEVLQSDYFSKQEVIGSQQYHDPMATENYTTESQANAVVTTIDSTMPSVNVNMSVEEEKLFHLSFEEQPPKQDDKDVIVPCDNQSVACPQEMIPVSTNLIDSVCTIETTLNTTDNEVKDEVAYFDYITKDSQSIEQNNDLEKQTLPEVSQVVESSYPEPTSSSSSSNQTVDDVKYRCDKCLKFYTTEKGLKKHLESHENQHKCEICSKEFSKLDALEKHRNVHSAKPHACKECNASFSKSSSLAKHMKVHAKASELAKNEVFLPETTTMKSDSDSDDDQREEDAFENAPEIFKCDECGQQCSTLKNLKRHTLIHGERKYSCTVCKKWFFRPDTLKKHAERHGHGLLDNLNDSNKLYESDDDLFPSAAVAAASDDKDVKKEDSEEEGTAATGEYKCQHCDKVMASKKGLRRHVVMHKPKPEPAVCEICKKVCASRARLALHQKTHAKPKEKVPREYLCHICSKVYPSNSSLTYHMRTHTGVKPHVCKICNSGFTTTTSLANHIRIHTGDKPFVCHVCSAAFAVSSAFRRHLTRHTGEANYLCKTCGKAFKRLSTLKEHTYTHSGEKPYVCKTCGAAYSHSGSLFAHQKRCRAQFNDMVVDDQQQQQQHQQPHQQQHHHHHHHHNNHNSSPVNAAVTAAAAGHHHIHVNSVQSAVRSLTVIGQMY